MSQQESSEEKWDYSLNIGGNVSKEQCESSPSSSSKIGGKLKTYASSSYSQDEKITLTEESSS